MENSTFVSDAELNEYINAAGSELYDILVTEYEDYFQSTTTLTVSAGSETVALPTDFYKLLGLWVKVGTRRYEILKFMVGEIVDYDQDITIPAVSGERVRYRIQGSDLYAVPAPSSDLSIEFWYVPQYTVLSADGDVISYAFVPGWEEYIITDACIRMLQKEESDTSVFERQKMQLAQRITLAGNKRDSANAQRVRDVYGTRRRPARWR